MILDRHGAAAVRIKAHYEAATGGAGQTTADRVANANPPYGARSSLPGVLQGPKRDITSFTRKELARKARYLHRNSPFIRGVIERFITYVIGTGLTPVPVTKRKGFNEKAKAAWKGWQKRALLDSKMSFTAAQRVIFRSVLLDGECFAMKTYGASGRPRIQLFEGHQFGNGLPDTLRNDKYDGIDLDPFGRPATYHYILDERIGNAKTEPLPADSIVHHFFPERPKQHRGVSVLASAINTAHDIDDILKLEKAAVKEHSSRASVIKTASGELNPEDYVGRSIFGDDGEEIVEYYKEIYGAETTVLRHGDDFQQFVPNRPGPAWQGFMDFLAHSVVFSLGGCPPSVVLPIKVGGADTRKDMAAAERIFSVYQSDFASQLQEVYEYVIEEELGAILPVDWRETEWQLPAKVTCDEGRERQQDREDVKAGLLTRREYFGRWGQDWREQTEQGADEAVYLNELATKKGIARAEIAMLDPNELSSTGKAEVDTEAGATEDVQATALNGAQVTALKQLAEAVALGTLPLESAKAAAIAAFPLVKIEIIERIFAPLANFEPKPQPQKQPSQDLPKPPEGGAKQDDADAN